MKAKEIRRKVSQLNYRIKELEEFVDAWRKKAYQWRAAAAEMGHMAAINEIEILRRQNEIAAESMSATFKRVYSYSKLKDLVPSSSVIKDLIPDPQE